MTFNGNAHVRLANAVGTLCGKWLLSYDHTDVPKELYKKHRIIKHRLSQCTSNRVAGELLITPKSIKVLQAMENLKNPSLIH